MRHRARNGWLGVSVAAMVVALMQSVGVPSAGSQQPPAGGQPAAGQPAGQQGRGGGRGAQPRVRKALLAWADTRNGQAQHAFTSHALAIVERLGYESGLWDTFIRTDSHIVFNQAQKTDGTPASGGPSLSNVDGIFFLGHRDVPIDEEQKKELLAFVRDDGKGIVAAHTALTAFESWPEFGDLLGGRYDGHPWHEMGTVINEAKDSPITKHFPPTFAINDEFYQVKNFSPDARVLLRLDTAKMPPHAELRNKSFPLVWTKNYGKGRVMYSSFGHDAAIFDNRDVAQMFLEGMKWVLGTAQ